MGASNTGSPLQDGAGFLFFEDQLEDHEIIVQETRSTVEKL